MSSPCDGVWSVKHEARLKRRDGGNKQEIVDEHAGVSKRDKNDVPEKPSDAVPGYLSRLHTRERARVLHTWLGLWYNPVSGPYQGLEIREQI